MRKHIRVASGLTGLALIFGVAAGTANAEGLGMHDDATTLRPGTAVAAKARTGDKPQTGYGFTGATGVKSISTTRAANSANGRIGRADDASMPVGFGFMLTRRADPEPQVKATGNKAYRAQIERHARANGVPVALALAVVRVESNYNPRARGRAGEVGLMQIKPQTARGMGFRGTTSALYNPDTNLQYGMKYLGGAYKLAKGDVCGTIMRYQGGHYARRMSKAAVVYCSKAKRHMAGTWA